MQPPGEREWAARLEASLRDGVDALGADTPAGARLAETVEFFEFLRKEMPQLLARWRAQRGEAGRASAVAPGRPA